jgi:hypothetical protein
MHSQISGVVQIRFRGPFHLNLNLCAAHTPYLGRGSQHSKLFMFTLRRVFINTQGGIGRLVIVTRKFWVPQLGQ